MVQRFRLTNLRIIGTPSSIGKANLIFHNLVPTQTTLLRNQIIFIYI